LIYVYGRPRCPGNTNTSMPSPTKCGPQIAPMTANVLRTSRIPIPNKDPDIGLAISRGSADSTKCLTNRPNHYHAWTTISMLYCDSVSLPLNRCALNFQPDDHLHSLHLSTSFYLVIAPQLSSPSPCHGGHKTWEISISRLNTRVGGVFLCTCNPGRQFLPELPFPKEKSGHA
jgi:hypothetical protein